MIPIVPAVIPRSAEAVLTLLPTLRFASEIQIDVVDGQLVEAISWPYQPAGEPSSIKHLTDGFTLEVDLMAVAPLSAASAWLEAGADMLVFHIETISLDALARFAETAKVTVGVSVLNDTPLETLVPYLAYADYVQLMGIAEIGAQAKPFDERVLTRTAELKNNFPNLPISIDGSVNKDTALRLKRAGADRLVVGSALTLATNPEEAYAELCALVNN